MWPYPVEGISRRRILALLAASLVPLKGYAQQIRDLADIIDASRLGAQSGLALWDISAGKMLESHAPERMLPPASVIKILTALYSLAHLGPQWKFKTRLLVTGPVKSGVLHGDLILEGGGDPTLDTDRLRTLALALAATGIRNITGDLVVYDGALPKITHIDEDQPSQVPYNPAISGINLNFNRVRLKWSVKDGLKYWFDAPGSGFEIPARNITGTDGIGGQAVWSRASDGREQWQVPVRVMRADGGVWLPVREPARYVGDVFRSLAEAEQVILPKATITSEARTGREIAMTEGPDLLFLLRGMLKYSTNITAEILGLRATQIVTGAVSGLEQSAAAMAAWAGETYGLLELKLKNHSGLSDASLWSAQDTARFLARVHEDLAPLLPDKPVVDQDRKPVSDRALEHNAKTGTLYFASGLAGYLEKQDRVLAYAIYTADLDKRVLIDRDAGSAPPSARGWAGRARYLQQQLIWRWVSTYLK